MSASEASTHASSTSSGGDGGPATEHLKAAAEHIELAAWLRSEEARGEVEARCAAMARPGTVMGEDELQALADVRGACVQVRSLVCVLESSDHGELLEPRNYMPAQKQNTPGGGGGDRFLGSVGNGTTMVLLQEVRAHRMSHFQKINLMRNEVGENDKKKEDEKEQQHVKDDRVEEPIP